MKKNLLSLVLLIVLSWTAEETQAQSIQEIYKALPTPSIQKYTEFGTALAIDGNVAVIGDKGDEEMGEDSGVAYVLEHDGTTWNKVATLRPSSSMALELFGESVAISGTTIVVGSSKYIEGGLTRVGAAYVFEQPAEGWTDMTETEILLASDREANDFFGATVAVDGTTILVGAPGDDHSGYTNNGSVYVFENSGGWSQVAKLTASDTDYSAAFGSSLAISGTTIVIGAHIAVSLRGTAYIFEKPGGGWSASMTETTNLVAPDAGSVDNFGISVDIEGSVIAIGAYNDTHSGVSFAGSVYIYNSSGTFQTKLTASDPEAWDYFGNSVSISGNSIIVGAKYIEEGLINTGGAYIFEYNAGWSEVAIITAADAEDQDHMGLAVGVSGDRVLVYGGRAVYATEKSGGWSSSSLNPLPLGAPVSTIGELFGKSVDVDNTIAVVGAYQADQPGGEEAGAAYVLEYDGSSWNPVARLSPSDGASNDFFGKSVAISGTTVVVGSYLHDPLNADGAGAVYVYERPEQGWGDMTETIKLIAPSPANQEKVGYSVDISDEVIVAGGNFSGYNNAYIFEKDGTWGHVATLTSSDAENGDYFGRSVAISETTIAVGAIGDDDNGAGSGSAYVFERPGTGWENMTETTKLTASDGVSADSFGSSLDMFGQSLVVGALKGDAGGVTDAGAVYVFDNPGAGWSETIKLTASDAAADDQFGGSVSIYDDKIVVSARFDDNTEYGINAGAVYVFANEEGWSEMTKIVATEGETSGFFGDDVCITDDWLLIGESVHDEQTQYSNEGAAFFYGFFGSLAQTVTTSESDGSYGIGDVLDIQVSFDEPVDVHTTGGTPQLKLETGTTDRYAIYTSGSGTSSLTFSYTIQEGDVSADLDYHSASGLELNGGEISHSSGSEVSLGLPEPGSAGSLADGHALIVDGVRPAVASITSTATSPTNTSPIPVTIAFDGTVSGLTAGSLSVTNGTAGNLSTSDNITYTVEITPTNDGSVTVTVPSDAAQDAVGNGNEAFSGSLNMTFDSTQPEAVFSTEVTEPTASNPIPLKVTFDELITGLEESDIVIGNGSVDPGSLSSLDEATYVFDVIPDGDIVTITADLAEGRVQDEAGNGNAAAEQFSLDYNNTIITVTSSGLDAVATNSSSLTITVVFSEEVSGFDPMNESGDIDLTNGTLSSATSTDNITYELEVIPVAEGLVALTIPEGVAVDAGTSSIGNEVSNTYDIIYDITPPTMVLHDEYQLGLDVSGNGLLAPTDLDNGSSDASGIAEMVVSREAFDCTDIATGTHIVTLTITDNAGNTNSGTTTVTVVFGDYVDEDLPMVSTQSIEIVLDENGVYTLSVEDIDNGSTDDCGLQSLELDITEFDCEDVGQNTVILTATDMYGNTNSATATVSILADTWYEDNDGDGFGNPEVSQIACTRPNGYVSDNTDCDDNDATAQVPVVWYLDNDGDGFGDAANSQTACTQPENYVLDNTDCDDNDATAQAPIVWYLDNDGDGFGDAANTQTSCSQPENYVTDNTDCDDNNELINPNQSDEAGSGEDKNCDGLYLWFIDADEDGFGSAETTSSANALPGIGESAVNTDCDDTNASIYPGAPESGGEDMNCDGVVLSIGLRGDEELYPNPLVDIVTLPKTIKAGSRIVVYNLNGKEVLTGRIDSNNQISLKSLDEGVYMLKANIDSEIIKEWKIIKQ